jgi:Kdo2-lipid IVA lauroyltransferase/acyltransferase
VNNADEKLSTDRGRLPPQVWRPRYWPTWFILLLLRISVWLPRAAVNALGAVLGDVMRRLNAKRRQIAQINLERCFPQWSAEEREDVLRRHFRLYVQSLLDFALLWWGSREALARLVRIRGLEHYEAQRRVGRPVVLLTGHFVGLEMGAAALTLRHPHVGLINPTKNRLINWFMDRGRTRFQGRLFLRSRGLRPLVRAIREGAGFYYLPDEDHGDDKSIFVPFFATQAARPTGAAKLVEACSAAALPASVRRLPGREGYELFIHPPLQGFPTGDTRADAVRINQALEQCILEDPAQYMWTFKLFRSQPDGRPSPYGARKDQAFR